MSKQLLIAILAAAAVIGVALYVTVGVNQSQVLTLKGKVLDVRAVTLDPAASLVVIDFEAANPSNKIFEIEEIAIDRMDGETATPSSLLSKRETANYFEYTKMLQPNPQLGIGEIVKGGETVKRMVVTRFELPVAGLANSVYRIRIGDINDVVAEITGKRP